MKFALFAAVLAMSALVGLGVAVSADEPLEDSDEYYYGGYHGYDHDGGDRHYHRGHGWDD